MINPSELDMAELRLQMRNLYKDKGPAVCAQAVYEMLLGANTLMEIIIEEEHNKNGK